MKKSPFARKWIFTPFTLTFFLLLSSPLQLHAVEYGGEIQNGDENVGETEPLFYGSPANNQDKRSSLSPAARERILRAAFNPPQFTVEYEPNQNQYVNDHPIITGFIIEKDERQVMEWNANENPPAHGATRPQEIPIVVNAPAVSNSETVTASAPVAGHPFGNGEAVKGCSVTGSPRVTLQWIGVMLLLIPAFVFGVTKKSSFPRKSSLNGWRGVWRIFFNGKLHKASTKLVPGAQGTFEN